MEEVKARAVEELRELNEVYKRAYLENDENAPLYNRDYVRVFNSLVNIGLFTYAELREYECDFE